MAELLTPDELLPVTADQARQIAQDETLHVLLVLGRAAVRGFAVGYVATFLALSWAVGE